MEHFIEEGAVKYTNLVDLDDPIYDTFYIEAVKSRDGKDTGIFKVFQRVNTEDVLLKYCPFCCKEL